MYNLSKRVLFPVLVMLSTLPKPANRVPINQLTSVTLQSIIIISYNRQSARCKQAATATQSPSKTETTALFPSLPASFPSVAWSFHAKLCCTHTNARTGAIRFGTPARIDQILHCDGALSIPCCTVSTMGIVPDCLHFRANP